MRDHTATVDSCLVTRNVHGDTLMSEPAVTPGCKDLLASLTSAPRDKHVTCRGSNSITTKC